MKIAIIGYESGAVGRWDPESCKTGLPGSEECVVYASNELARRGYKVTVYMNPPPTSSWCDSNSNPRWTHVSRYNFDDDHDVAIMWRRFDQQNGRIKANKVYFWPHDSPRPAANMWFPSFDGVFALTKYHRQQFLDNWKNYGRLPYIICGNGVVTTQFTKPMSYKNPYSMGYYSNYSRGLVILIDCWPEIKAAYPEATLDICYGRETWNTMCEQDLKRLISKIEEYAPLGVTEHGKIGHEELAQLMQTTSILAYPCTDYCETFCITVVKAQLAGMIPVTSRIAALNETVHPDAPCVDRVHTSAEKQVYKETLMATLARVDGDTRAERFKYRHFAQQFSWENCIDIWTTMIGPA